MILKIELEEAAWQAVINMLAERPYKESGPLITEMARQFGIQRGQKNNDDNVVPMKG